MSIKSIVKGFASLVLRETGNLSLEVEQMAEKRLEVCATCPERTKQFGASQCKICGCILKAKTLVPDEKCPIHKW